MNNENLEIVDIEEAKNVDDDVFACVREAIKKDVGSMTADSYFANVVRLHLVSHPKEYTALMKKYKNDFANMCCELTNELNKLLIGQSVGNKEYEKLLKEIKSKENQLKKIDDEFAETMKNNDQKQIQELAKEKMSICDEITKLQKRLSRMSPTEEKDLSYHATQLSGLINKVQSALADIIPESEPSDIDARKALKFEKKMTLEDALFTLLWNTRHETLPLSVLNMKGWAARFAQRIVCGEQAVSNLPTMLIFRSRTDNGQVKGSSGKTTIIGSCWRLLREHGLNVADPNANVEIPTTERISKSLSDKSLVVMEDVKYGSNNVWETLNKYLDGMAIQNRGKYQKEGSVYGFANVIASTNYDLPYTNNQRYPMVEFTPNAAAIVCRHELVQKHAKFSTNENNRCYDFRDAWETLFSYAFDNYNQWLSEYDLCRKDVLKKCSVQRSKLENMILAYCEHNASATMPNKVFSVPELIQFINQNFKGELSGTPKFNSIYTALLNLGVKEYGKVTNLYNKRFEFPTIDFNTKSEKDSVTIIWEWINNNASKSPDKQDDVLTM